MKTGIFARALMLLMLLVAPLGVKADGIADRKIELANEIVKAGGPFQCSDKSSDVAFLLLSSVGFSWNNLENDSEGLTRLKTTLKKPKYRKLNSFVKSNLALKIFMGFTSDEYRKDPLAAISKMLPGSVFHETDSAGAVTTYMKFNKAGRVTLFNPSRESDTHAVGTYKVVMLDGVVSADISFTQEAAKIYSGRYRVNDEPVLGSHYMFDTRSFQVTLEGNDLQRFSSDQDQTECSDY